MDAADVLSRLHDVRDPPVGLAEIAGNTLAGGAVGLASALLLGLLLRALTDQLPSPHAAILAELTRTRALDPDQRLLAQAKLLDRVAPGADAAWERLRADLRDALYRPSPALDPERVEADIRHLLSQAGA